MWVTAQWKHFSSMKRLHSMLHRKGSSQQKKIVCKAIWNNHNSLSHSVLQSYPASFLSLKPSLINMKCRACNLCQMTSRFLPKNFRGWFTDVLEHTTPIAIWRLGIFENPGHSPENQEMEKKYYHPCSRQRLQGDRKSKAWVIKDALSPSSKIRVHYDASDIPAG